MKALNIVLIIAVIISVLSCGKKDEKVNSENQSSAQNVTQNTQNANVNNKWIGKYSFEESAKNVTGEGSQSWSYAVTVKENPDKSLSAEISIDGFQTMSRIEAEVKANERSAEFIFAKYLPENMFEIYKKGDRLFVFELNDNNEIITKWDKMKPNVIDNKNGGKSMFKKILS